MNKLLINLYIFCQLKRVRYHNKGYDLLRVNIEIGDHLVVSSMEAAIFKINMCDKPHRGMCY